MIRDGAIVNTQKASYEPQCVAINPGATEVAVGGSDKVSPSLCLSLSAEHSTDVPGFFSE